MGSFEWRVPRKLNCYGYEREFGAEADLVQTPMDCLCLLEAANTACLSTAGCCSLVQGEHPALLWFMAAMGCSSCSLLQDCSRPDFALLNFCLPFPPRGRKWVETAFPLLFRALLSSSVFCSSTCTSACLIWN